MTAAVGVRSSALGSPDCTLSCQAVQNVHRLPRRAPLSHAPLPLESADEPVKVAKSNYCFLWGVRMNLFPTL